MRNLVATTNHWKQRQCDTLIGGALWEKALVPGDARTISHHGNLPSPHSTARKYDSSARATIGRASALFDRTKQGQQG